MHFGIGTLHGVKFDSIGILAGLHRRNGSATHADAVVVATHDHDFFAGYRCAFDSIFLCRKTYTAGKHDNFVVGIHAPVFVVFECKQRTTDKWLSELVAEVRCTV